MGTKKISILTSDEAKLLADAIKGPFYIYDEAAIKKNAKKLMDAFSWNQGFREYFAVKANPIPDLVKILTDLGCGCDCSSKPELMIAKCLEAPIMFSSNDTPEDEFVYADRIGGIINLDDITHIPVLQKVLKKIPETICCRYNCGGTFNVSANCMGTPEDAKYGMTKAQIFEAFRQLKELGVKNFGLHAFLASNTLTNEYYPKLARELFNLAVELKKELSVNIAFVNLSGGIGIPYELDDEPNDILAISKGVKKAYDEILIPNGMEPAIYTELGRYMLGPYGQLVTKVINVKHTYKEYIGCDACAANLMRPAMYRAYHHIIVLGKEDQEANCTYDVTGSLCENNDKFAIDRKLPKIEVGDFLVICDAGAHGSAMGYNYNGKLHCAEFLKTSAGRFIQIKGPQMIEDYFRNFRINPITGEERWPKD
jgi:diaminopimelate decarboxylase